MSVFWNIDKNSKIDEVTLIEHTLKYGDFDDIVDLFKKIDKNRIKEVWLKTMATDKRFLKVNLMIARIFFDMDVEKDYFEGLNNARFEVKVSVK
ncbi:hypothetical protein [Hippea sp. KM1]|uniref:hypothetical protein n=1 Tax=Hippea sp. KM1 TaxID=944481 RepID=UPI00046CF78B|nr:hypothetical protein [Hippea sp. KM1]